MISGILFYQVDNIIEYNDSSQAEDVLFFLNLSVNNSIMGNLVNIWNHFSAPGIMSSVFSFETPVTFV